MKCHECDADADPCMDMDFTDVEPGAVLHWCTACGRGAHAMNAALSKAFETRPGFADELLAEIDAVERGMS